MVAPASLTVLCNPLPAARPTSPVASKYTQVHTFCLLTPSGSVFQHEHNHDLENEPPPEQDAQAFLNKSTNLTISKPTRHYTITHHGLSISITLCVSPSSRGSLLSRLIGRQTTGRTGLFSLLESFGGPASFGMTTTLRMMRMIYIIW